MADPATTPEPPSPQEVTAAWVEAVMDRGDLRSAWPRTDETLRMVLAQDWIWTHRHHPWVGHGTDWDRLARALSDPEPDHALWDRFAEEVLELWQKIWEGFNTRTWSAAEDPEVLDLDLEIVTFSETDGSGRDAFARRFAVRHGTEGWKVASINGEQLFVPGWPPSLEKPAR